MFFFFKQKTAYEMRISDWSSDVCSSDLSARAKRGAMATMAAAGASAPSAVITAPNARAIMPETTGIALMARGAIGTMISDMASARTRTAIAARAIAIGAPARIAPRTGTTRATHHPESTERRGGEQGVQNGRIRWE